MSLPVHLTKGWPRDGSTKRQNQLDAWLHSSLNSSLQKRATRLAAQLTAQLRS